MKNFFSYLFFYMRYIHKPCQESTRNFNIMISLYKII